MGVGAGPQITLLEREAQLSTIDAELRRAREGAGRLVTIEGPPGIGKTQLLRAVERLAGHQGAMVLGGSGDPFEREHPYATVRAAFAAVLSDPELGPAVLDGRAAAARQVLEAQPGAGTEPPAMAALDALFWATVGLCERGPVLLAIDDGHWVDPPSLRFLSYLGRRLDGLPALIVYAYRPGGPSIDAESHRAFLAGTDHVAIGLEPLGPEATATLVRSTLGPEADEEFCRACYRSSGGTPLLVRELVRTVATRGIEPSAAGVGALEELGPAAVARTVALRLAQLPPEARRLAEACAVVGERAPLRHAAVLAGLGTQAASAAARELRRADILAPVADVAFVHPLIGDALAQCLDPLAAAEAHDRAAMLLRNEQAPAQDVARHLLEVPGGGESWRVETLRAAAAAATAAGEPEAATSYLRRALAEPPAGEQRVDVLIELAAAELPLSFEATTGHLREALSLIADRRARALTAGQLAGMLQTADPAGSQQLALEAIDELGDADDDLRRELLALVVQTATLRSDSGELPAEALRSIRSEAAAGGDGASLLAATLTYWDAWRGVPAAEIAPQFERAFSGDWLRLVEKGGGPHTMAFLALLATDSQIAPRVVEEWTRFGRRTERMAAIGGANMFAAHLHLARGELEDAAAEAEDSLEAFEIWGMRGIALAHAAAAAAGAALRLGDLDGAARALERAGVSDREAGAVGLHGLLAARAELRAAGGELRVALTETLELGRRFEALGGRNPALLPWRSRAALLLAELGEDRGEARRLAAEELELARAWGTPRAIGRALTAVGALADGERAVATLAEAVAELEGAPAPLELAEALIALGEALCEAGREAEARPHLHRALGLAAERRAAPVEERSRKALVAAGGRPRRAAVRGPQALTARERRVAALAAAGRTNREIAEELYLVPRTVEGHLSNAYRKLGIGSRAELREALGTPAEAE